MRSPRFAVLLLLFFGSGACGLIYQVLWLRQLSLVFGVTVYAASTVLAVFMSGLALGSLLAGRLATRVHRPLAAFGVVEILIGLLAISTPAGLQAAAVVYDALYRAFPDALGLLTLARFVCSFPVLLGPTILMGLTLPLLSASALVRGDGVGTRVSALYAGNTAGAVTGALLGGYVFIGSLGMHRTFLVAAALNTLIGLGALLLSRQSDALAPAAPMAQSATLPVVTDRTRRAIAVVMAMSGAIALALEIVWFRILVQFLTATTYAFTTMLATVLGGIALGGAIGARVLAKPRDWHAILVRVLIGTAVAIVFSVIFLTWSFQAGWKTSALVQACAAAILPAAVLMGVAFPIALRIGAFAETGETADGRAVARGVGRLYALNVAGAIVGAIAGGFIFLPWLGSRPSLIVLAALYLVAALLLVASHPRRRAILVRAIPAIALFAVGSAFVPDPFVATIARRHGPGRHEVWRDEGAQTAVSIQRAGPRRIMFLDGLHQADDTPSMVQLHRIIGHLPMILHPEPERVLVIGLGGGTTPGAISQYPGTHVDIIELSPGVRRAAAEFAHVNYDVLGQPNVRIRMDDGRNFLRLTDERFDVITADVIQPTNAGAGMLYSREYFTLVRRALRPHGLVMQWIGDGSRPAEHWKILMRTFLSVFPNTTLWFNGSLMIGSVEPLRVDPVRVEARMRDPRVRAILDEIGVTDLDVLRSWYTAGPAVLHEFVGPGEILTDDRPLLEYHRSLAEGRPRTDLTRLRGRPDEVFVAD